MSFLIILFLSIWNSANATHYVLGYSSVDDWEIRWWGSTKYSTEWSNSISMWNNYWNINIAPDTTFTYEDVTVSDVYLSSASRSWMHSYYLFGTDTIKLNKYYLDWDSVSWDFSSSEKQHTIGHELWHALWLDHHNLYWNVLRSWKWTYTILWSQDKYDYDYLW